MATMEDLVREVAESATVTESVLTFISGLSTQLGQVQAELDLAKVTNAKLDEVVAGLQAQQDKLAAAIAPPVGAPAEVVPPQDVPVEPAPVVEPPPPNPPADPAA